MAKSTTHSGKTVLPCVRGQQAVLEGFYLGWRAFKTVGPRQIQAQRLDKRCITSIGYLYQSLLQRQLTPGGWRESGMSPEVNSPLHELFHAPA